MLRLMVSLGMFDARALSMAVRNRGLPSGSPPPRAATVISLRSFVQPLDFLASDAAFACLIFDQRLCPDIRNPVARQRVAAQGRVFMYPGGVRFSALCLMVLAACEGPVLELPRRGNGAGGPVWIDKS